MDTQTVLMAALVIVAVGAAGVAVSLAEDSGDAPYVSAVALPVWCALWAVGAALRWVWGAARPP